MTGPAHLARGTLWQQILRTSDSAKRCGALQSWQSETTVVEDGGVPFIVRVLTHLDAKDEATRAAEAQGRNPFLPYEEDLFVADLSPTHLCLLNKFNVVDHHLLIVTREFEEQERELRERDFDALAVCLSELDGLGFYNAGRRAGASQPHKHLHFVIGSVGGHGRAPIEALASRCAGREGRIGTVDALSFEHGCLMLPSDLFAGGSAANSEAGALLARSYRQLAEACSVDPGRDPYNLLVTRDWMFLVPRSCGRFESISVNALGFSGSVLVRNPGELERVRAVGPMHILKRVGRPRRDL